MASVFALPFDAETLPVEQSDIIQILDWNLNLWRYNGKDGYNGTALSL